MKNFKRRDVLKAGISGLGMSTLGMSAQAQQTRGVSTSSIKLGQVVATTGPVAIYGVPIRAGTQAYLGLVNDRGGVNGRKIELLSEDSAFSTPQSLAIARRYMSDDGIFALINSMGTAQVSALIPYLVEQEKTPIFGTYGGAVEWFNPAKEGLFGLQVLYEDLAGALGRWSAKEGHKNIMAVHIEGASFAKAAKAVEPMVKAASPQGTVDFLPVKLPTQDYAPIILQIAQKRPDAIVAMLIESEFVTFMRELRNQGVKVPVYAWGPVVTLRTLQNGGTNMEGLKAFSWTKAPMSSAPAVAEYRQALQKYAPAEKPDFVSLFNFAQTKVFVEALSRVKGPLTQASFYQALYSLKNYDSGILPPVTFSPTRHQGLTSLVPLQVRNGEWVELGGMIDTSDPKW
jgi:ABC-type branched-subunit amino acid transport system substrate-binding protein